jgi:hypothetical protein
MKRIACPAAGVLKTIRSLYFNVSPDVPVIAKVTSVRFEVTRTGRCNIGLLSCRNNPLDDYRGIPVMSLAGAADELSNLSARSHGRLESPAVRNGAGQT